MVQQHKLFEMENVKGSIKNTVNLLNILRENREIILKEEQEKAVLELISANYILAILPTGFGKSMIYTIFALASEDVRSLKSCVLVISPLQSLIDDQIAAIEALSCTALELTSDNIDSVIKDPPQFLFCTAEKC